MCSGVVAVASQVWSKDDDSDTSQTRNPEAKPKKELYLACAEIVILRTLKMGIQLDFVTTVGNGMFSAQRRLICTPKAVWSKGTKRELVISGHWTGM